jgi:hypothetical protein
MRALPPTRWCGTMRQSWNRAALAAPLSERARRIFEAVRRMCEWRLGRAPALDNSPADLDPTVTAAELVLCLKRIRKSIDFWTKEGGRQGYLNFVSKYVR